MRVKILNISIQKDQKRGNFTVLPEAHKEPEKKNIEPLKFHFIFLFILSIFTHSALHNPHTKNNTIPSILEFYDFFIAYFLLMRIFSHEIMFLKQYPHGKLRKKNDYHSSICRIAIHTNDDSYLFKMNSSFFGFVIYPVT